MENYREIPGYPNYGVNKNGQVKNLKRGLLLNPFINQTYLTVSLFRDGIRKPMHIHKIMAITYLDHTPNGSKIVVDHINEDRLDNRLENLQVIPQRENISRSIKRDLPIGVRQSGNKYTASIRINNKRPYLGTFDTPEAASAAYQQALLNL